MPKSTLTRRQQQLLDYLKKQHRDTGMAPTTREIQAHFGFASQTAAVSHLRALERKGAIQRLPNKARAVIFPETRKRAEILEIPLYGSIPAGMPGSTQETPGSVISIDRSTLGLSRHARVFALSVRGDSMIDAQIQDGDTAIFEKRQAKHGDIVAALIDGETTLKRFLVRRNKPYLKAENSAYPDLLPAQSLEVQGVMVLLMRQMA